MRSARVQPFSRIVEIDPAADLQPSGIGLQRRSGLLAIARTEHDDVSAFEAVAMVELGVPRGWPFRDKVRLQPSRIGT